MGFNLKNKVEFHPITFYDVNRGAQLKRDALYTYIYTHTKLMYTCEYINTIPLVLSNTSLANLIDRFECL